jgi:hypothetical protein
MNYSAALDDANVGIQKMAQNPLGKFIPKSQKRRQLHLFKLSKSIIPATEQAHSSPVKVRGMKMRFHSTMRRTHCTE